MTGRGRLRFLLRLRAIADFNFAFCPGGMKCACFFKSLIISSVITLRLKRRSALSIDSLLLTVTKAILNLLSPYLLLPLMNFLYSDETNIKHVFEPFGQVASVKICLLPECFYLLL